MASYDIQEKLVPQQQHQNLIALKALLQLHGAIVISNRWEWVESSGNNLLDYLTRQKGRNI